MKLAGICTKSKGIGTTVSVYCLSTVGEITIAGGWRWRIPNIAEDTVVRWNELDSGGIA
jgi:hypothetical protein